MKRFFIALPNIQWGLMAKKMFSEIRKLSEFEKDFKKLSKKFRTLEEDLELFIKTQFHLFHNLNVDNKGIVRITGLGIDYPEIYKRKINR